MQNKNEGSNKTANITISPVTCEHIRSTALDELHVGTGNHATTIWSAIDADVIRQHAECGPANVTAQSVADAIGYVLAEKLITGNIRKPEQRTLFKPDTARFVMGRAKIMVRLFSGMSTNKVMFAILSDIAHNTMTKNPTDVSDTDIRDAVGAAILARLPKDNSNTN